MSLNSSEIVSYQSRQTWRDYLTKYFLCSGVVKCPNDDVGPLVLTKEKSKIILCEEDRYHSNRSGLSLTIKDHTKLRYFVFFIESVREENAFSDKSFLIGSWYIIACHQH